MSTPPDNRVAVRKTELCITYCTTINITAVPCTIKKKNPSHASLTLAINNWKRVTTGKGHQKKSRQAG